MHYPTPLGPYPIGDAKAHSASIQKCLDKKPQLLLEGHGLSAYSEASVQAAPAAHAGAAEGHPAIGSSRCSGAWCAR